MTLEELEELLDFVHSGGISEEKGFEDTSDDERNQVIEEFKRLQQDNARLRALIKRAEQEGTTISTDVCAACPWCFEYVDHPHDPGCPAFMPNGEVK